MNEKTTDDRAHLTQPARRNFVAGCLCGVASAMVSSSAFAVASNSQTSFVLSGRVTDSIGVPLRGAGVSIAGAQVAFTDADGRFLTTRVDISSSHVHCSVSIDGQSRHYPISLVRQMSPIDIDGLATVNCVWSA